MSEQNMFDVAIIGMAGRFPKAKNVDEFWENLKAGKECITFFSDDELRASGISEENIKDANYIKAYGAVEDIEMFDASFFNITSREAELTDPQQRIFLECCWEALEDAGYVPEKYDGIVGVYGGVSNNTYLLNNLAKSEVFEHAGMYPIMIGNEKDFLCTRVAYKLNLKGPSMTVQTACSTSLVAVHMACQSILNGECDMAIAGGATIRVPQKAGYQYQDGGILSPDGHCRAFDESARGTVIGSGAGVVVLKALSAAIKDNDHIYAVIKGTAINNDGSMKVGFTAPSVEGQSKAIMEALTVAEVSPSSIGYIETHGTGTQLGDPIEIAALKKAFQLEEYNTCPIGSVKANIGHLDVASGVVGLIKTVLMLEHKMLLPNINFKRSNPKLNLENSPFFVNSKLTEWKSNGDLRRAGVSSFGLGGTNAHVVVEEKLQQEVPRSTINEEYTWNLITVSAKTFESLHKIKKNIVRFFEHKPSVKFGDAAYTLALGRREFGCRFYCICKNKIDFINQVSGKNLIGSAQREIDNKLHKIVFLFSELRDIDRAAVREIYENEPLFRKSLNEFFTIAWSKFGISLDKMLLEPKSEQIKENQAIAVLSLQVALASFFHQLGIHADLCAGNFTGKVAACCIDGLLTIEEAITILSYPVEVQDKFVCSLDNQDKYIDLESGGNTHFIDSCLKSDQENCNIVIALGIVPEDIISSVGNEKNIILYTLETGSATQPINVQLLNIVGQIWTRGYSIDWSALYKDSSCKRISLPTYVFERKKYWIEGKLSSQDYSTQQVAAIVDSDIDLKEPVLTLVDVGSKLKRLISNLIGVEKIEDNDDLYELCGDSFEALQLNNEIEKQFVLKLPIKNIIENNTVDKLSNYIWEHLNGFHNVKSVHEDSLVRFRIQGSKTPIFLIHPAGGTVMGYKALVKYLPSEYPVYGIQYTYKDERHTLRTIENIAQDYITLIQEIQPKGPIILAGHSFGGNAAFEIAVRLQKLGRIVEHLIMFDSHPPLAYYSNQVFDETLFLKAFPRVCAMYFDKRAELPNIEIDGLEGVIQYLKSNGWIPWGFDYHQFKSYYNIWRSNHNSLRTHMPKDRYSGNLIFFRAETMQPKEIIEELNINLKAGMDMEEWSKLTMGKVKLIEVPGTHYTMLNEPNVRTIAEELNKILK